MVRLVDDLLDVARVSRGKISITKCSVDLGDILGRAVEAVEPMIATGLHELTLTRPLNGEVLLVEGDAVRLTHVVSNLLNNAVKYTPRGGHIWLSAAREGDEGVVRVRDTGIGIPPEMLSQVFDLFYQVDRSIDRAKGGLGIGLTLVRSIVELHGGRVE